MSASSIAASTAVSASPQALLDKLNQACKRVEEVAKDSKEAQELFQSTYQGPFRDLFLRVGTLARERKELSPLLDNLEAAWRSSLPSVALPKLVPKKKPLEIFPQTSFEDVLKLIDKHITDAGALMTIVRYLQSILEEIKPKKLKALPFKASFDKVLGTNPPPPIVEAYSKLRKACEDKLFDFNIEESLRVGTDQKRLESLKRIAAPTGPQQRAIEALSKTTKPIKSQSSVKSAGTSTGKATASSGKVPAPTTASSKRPLSVSGTAKKTISKKYSDSEEENDDDDSDRERRRPPIKKKKPMTQAEFEREFLRRARESNIRDELEDIRSRRIGEYEDAHADSE